MAAARVRQLEDKIARYERILSNCSRCKASLASEEELEDARSPVVTPTTGGPLGEAGPRVPSTASALPPKDPMTTGRQGQPSRPSKQNKATSRPTITPRNADAAGPPASASRFAKTAKGPSRDVERSSGRLTKQTTVDTASSSSGSSSTQQNPTAHSLHLRPTSLRPSSSRTDIPSADISVTGRPRNDSKKPGDWLVSANIMLGEIPLGWVWLARVVGLGESMLAAVAVDKTSIPEDSAHPADNTQNKDHLLRLVRGFAHRHSVMRVNFQQFLLVCLCKVLSVQKVPQRSIVETLQICISDTSERNIDKYLKGAEWANELMDRLFFTDWGYRAVDLLLLCKYDVNATDLYANVHHQGDRSVAMYGRIASALDSTIDHFVSHLNRPEYHHDLEEIPDRVYSTVPWIVKKEFADEVS